ncbi:hypothetical protein SH661x_004549 [Planctomicrobium sp. SH661]|uniref:hypothetical protein n=1 Tax=Planctomicrobium sp. SH661 TaxID=3448124 RepID=UPI003F5C44F6
MSESKDLTPSEKMRAALPNDSRDSRTRPWLAILTGMFAALFLIGCCVCGIAAWWFRPLIRENPEQAKSLTQQIVDIAIPEPFQPHGLIDWNLAFVMHLRGVYYERYVGDGVLTLLEVNTQLSHDETIRNHIRKTLLEEGAGGTELIVDHSQTHREIFTISGQQIPFTFEVARDGAEIFHLVEGVFPGKNGQVLLTMRVDELHWKNEADFAAVEPGKPASIVPIWVWDMISSIGHPPRQDFVPSGQESGDRN